MAYTPQLTTLGFVLSADRQRVLLVHRTARADDQQLGKFNGLGGKVERGEDIVACMKRELREEAGIDATALRLRGTVSWPGFGKAGEDVFGCVFVIDEFRGTPRAASVEGPLTWQRLDELDQLPMWEGDRHFLPLVFDEKVNQFHAVLPYRDGRPVGWKVSLL